MAARPDAAMDWAGTGSGWGSRIACSISHTIPKTAVMARFRPSLAGSGAGMAVRQGDTTTIDEADTEAIPGSRIACSISHITPKTAVPARFRPSLKMTCLAGRGGSKLAPAFIPTEKRRLDVGSRPGKSNSKGRLSTVSGKRRP